MINKCIFLHFRYKYISFHIVSPNNAEKQLKKATTQAGTFLIRNIILESIPSHLHDGFTIRHYHIYIEFNKYYIDSRVRFDSLNDLVHHYMMEADGLHCSLTVPIPKQKNMPIVMKKQSQINKLLLEFLNCINAGQFGEIFKGYRASHN